MKEPYKWNYNIKIKTKEGTFDYENEPIEKIESIIQEHPDYEEISAVHSKKLVKRKQIRSNNEKRK